MSMRLSFLLWLLLPPLAAAQGTAALRDPTRPPPEALVAQGGEPASVAEAGPRKPVLQSVLVGKGYQGREVAVIDGEIVRKGERFRGAVLQDVRPNEVVLRRGAQTEILVLFPLAAGSRKK